ncbi:hypothetical protein F5884DRAFT_278881 [Xylogone sp. PMI_703]|nr:hypothetical protein F5884DRAFT_278881 [Xylogone sp. PMI_703]
MSDTQDPDSSSSSGGTPEPIEVPRDRWCHQLRKLQEEVEHLGLYASKRNCNRLKIYATKVTLDEKGEQCPEFCFFKPYHSSLPAIDTKSTGRKFRPYERDPHPGSLSLHDWEASMSLHRYYIRYMAVCGMDVDETDEESWSSGDIADFRIAHPLAGPQYSVEYLTDDPTHQKPHIMCNMIHGINADSRLLRSELLAIIILITSRFESEVFAQHKTVPVLLHSFFAPQQARILHAYYDIKEGELIIAYSQTFDFRDVNNSALQLLARWSFSHRVGDTKHQGIRGELPIRKSARQLEYEERRIAFQRQDPAERHEAAQRQTSDVVDAVVERNKAADRRRSAERHFAASMEASRQALRELRVALHPEEQEVTEARPGDDLEQPPQHET